MRCHAMPAGTPVGIRARSAAAPRGRAVGRLLTLAAFVAGGWLAAAAPPAVADAVKLDKPVRVSTVAADKSKVSGRIASYDEAGFELLDDKNVAKTVPWSSLPPAKVMEVYALLLPKGTAQDWIAAGRVMYHLEGGKDVGEKAFARALRLDSRVKAAVDDAKKAPPGMAVAAGGGGGGGGDGKELIGEAGKVLNRDEVLK